MTKDKGSNEQDGGSAAPDDKASGGPKHMSKADIRKGPKRFYKQVTIDLDDGLHAIRLDGRPVKTPMKQQLAVPSEALAKAIVKEWEDQDEYIKHETMIFTKLANTAVDRGVNIRRDIIDEVLSFSGTDLICYRAIDPTSLVTMEAEGWDPYLAWFKSEHDIHFKTASGILHVRQDQAELKKVEALIEPFNEFALTALHNMTSISGSALLSLCLLLDDRQAIDIWNVAHIDEDFQIERWGADDDAQLRRTKRLKEFLVTHEFFLLAK